MINIIVACDAPLKLAPEVLLPSQDSLKTMSHEDSEKLSRSIEKHGIDFSLTVWKDKKGQYHLVDGHGRIALIQHKIQSGEWCVPEVPCVNTHAKTLQDAKMKILRSSSTYHKITNQGLYEFAIGDLGLNIDSLTEFSLPDFSFPDFKMEFGDGSVGESLDKSSLSDRETVSEDSYRNQHIKGLNLFYSNEEFHRVVTELDLLCNHYKIKDHAEMVRRLIGEAHHSIASDG